MKFYGRCLWTLRGLYQPGSLFSFFKLSLIYLADIERGARNPPLESVRRNAGALDMPLSELMRVAEAEL